MSLTNHKRAHEHRVRNNLAGRAVPIKRDHNKGMADFVQVLCSGAAATDDDAQMPKTTGVEVSS